MTTQNQTPRRMVTCVLCDRRGIATGFDRFGEDRGAIAGKYRCKDTTKCMDRSSAAARAKMRRGR